MSTLIVFDLDATFWDNEMYCLSGPPFSQHPKHRHIVVDGRGDQVALTSGTLHALSEIVHNSAFQGSKIGVASRTNYAEWANTCLSLLQIEVRGEWVSVDSILHFKQIFPGDKKTHFRRLKQDSGIPFEEMSFFDNENRNIRSVAQLGVNCFFTPHAMTVKAWNDFLIAVHLFDDNNENDDNDEDECSGCSED